jgi:hypothetical protein
MILLGLGRLTLAARRLRMGRRVWLTGEIRVLLFEPTAARPGLVEAARPFRHEVLAAERAAPHKRDRVIGGQRGSAGGALAAPPAGHLTPVDRPQERDPAHIAAGPIVRHLVSLGNNHRSVR